MEGNTTVCVCVSVYEAVILIFSAECHHLNYSVFKCAVISISLVLKGNESQQV